MKFQMCLKLIYALTTEMAIDAMESRGIFYLTEDNRVVWGEYDWVDETTSFTISRDFFGVVGISEEAPGLLQGRVEIFRVRVKAWRNQDADFDERRAVAEIFFCTPESVRENRR